ncbi:LytR/AlgR family response regulator transcription factor [Hydrotalea sp.]|uniref:LytR/AlgR family response regulator transcription factor n=1 Tax=Hydrotalea sp. TaxID=2881279 RepID=UPI003D0CE99E
MKVVIVEDEFLTAQRLDGMLNKYDSTIEVQAILPSVADAVQWFKENQGTDLIFMDIHLEDGQCFQIFETINLEIPIIFTTAYDEYMIKAFKVNSIDYLMKPINFEELVQAIEKFKKLHSPVYNEDENWPTEGLQQLMHSLQPGTSSYKSRFLISLGSRLKTVETADIQYFYSADKITFLVTADNQRYPLEFSLDKLCALLNPAEFFRINRQTIVKLNAISAIHVFPKGKLKVDIQPAFKDELFVSLDRVTEFKEWLGK